MNHLLSFNDVSIIPKFSTVRSRKDVSMDVEFMGVRLSTPILSANMDTITGHKMAIAMREAGGLGVLHRFNTIEENVAEYKLSPSETIVSTGIGENEFNRATALYNAGARRFLIDVAHGASIAVLEHYNRLVEAYPDIKLAVGNFATYESLDLFLYQVKRLPDAVKVNVGSGSVCTTRVVTGCGIPSVSSLLQIRDLKIPIIQDGGMKNSGDVAKALVAGATVVMTGYLLAGTDEACGEEFSKAFNGTRAELNDYLKHQYKEGVKKGYVNPSISEESFIEQYSKQYEPFLKKYRGSASAESYKVQNKEASHRIPEGDIVYVNTKGSVAEIISNIKAGIASAMSYTNSHTLDDLKSAELAIISDRGYTEGTPHAKHRV